MSHLFAVNLALLLRATVQPYLRSDDVVPVYSPSAALAVVQPAECE